MKYGLNNYKKEDEVLFMNYAVTGNTLERGESTVYWTMVNRNPPLRHKGGLSGVLEHFGASKTMIKYEIVLKKLK